LADIVTARDNLVNALVQRAEANTLREQGLLVRVAESAAVFRLLQLCAHWHIVMDFDGVVDARLQSMGFTVVEIPPKAAKMPVEPTESPALAA
jgi:hypothetical protein